MVKLHLTKETWFGVDDGVAVSSHYDMVTSLHWESNP